MTRWLWFGCFLCGYAVPLFAQSASEQPVAERLNSFFETAFQEELSLSPMQQSYLGIKKDYHQLDDYSDAAATESLALSVRHLAKLRREFDIDDLDRQQQLSFRLFEYRGERTIASFPWRMHDFPINQMFGVHSRIPSFMINVHKVDSSLDASAYLSRLRALPSVFEQIEEKLRIQQSLGIIPPKLVFPLVIDDCRNVITGAPFDDSEQPSAVFSDFLSKVEELQDLGPDDKQGLIQEARETLVNHVEPAYARLILTLEEIAEFAKNDSGVWSLPDGDAYYRHRLREITTTDLSPEQIHEIGLAEVTRIHNEMREVMKTVEFGGELADFFTFMREDDQFYYANTQEGRERYMSEAKEMIDRMRASLDHMFIIKPRATMVIKRVEPFREKSAGTAFYMSPSPDGSRPGTYYANLSDMRRMPIYQMEALAFHEGIPGHHMQRSIAQELMGIPKFRRFGSFTAYTEGWGLYCELLPKDFGYYRDPYSDFGRLAMELWRAARLVVDTGLHHHRWSRQRAIDYLRQNTPNATDECERAINRYLVMPGQATAYKIGMLKIMELRQRAIDALGDEFDIREFHDVLLADGALPLGVLEEQVVHWIEAKKAG